MPFFSNDLMALFKVNKRKNTEFEHRFLYV